MDIYEILKDLQPDEDIRIDCSRLSNTVNFRLRKGSATKKEYCEIYSFTTEELALAYDASGLVKDRINEMFFKIRKAHAEGAVYDKDSSIQGK